MDNSNFKSINPNDNKAWMLERKYKKIKLSGDLAEYVGVSVSALSQYENDKFSLSPEKIARYKNFISAYPDKPKRIADSR